LLNISMIGSRASMVFTPAYTPSKSGVHRRSSDEGFIQAAVDRDLHALMVTDQEMLLGSLLKSANSKFILTETSGSFHRAFLTHSPHSIDARVSEILSSISWIHFSSVDVRLDALHNAQQYGERDRV